MLCMSWFSWKMSSSTPLPHPLYILRTGISTVTSVHDEAELLKERMLRHLKTKS